jgi:hypothetical protein
LSQSLVVIAGEFVEEQSWRGGRVSWSRRIARTISPVKQGLNPAVRQKKPALVDDQRRFFISDVVALAR